MSDKEWSKQVMGSGCFCEVCGVSSTAPYFAPHHYIHRSQSSRLRNEVRNGIRICPICHQKAHSAGGIKFIEDWMKANRPADKKYCDEKLRLEREIK